MDDLARWRIAVGERITALFDRLLFGALREQVLHGVSVDVGLRLMSR
jgi:hypothetical protein